MWALGNLLDVNSFKFLCEGEYEETGKQMMIYLMIMILLLEQYDTYM